MVAKAERAKGVTVERELASNEVDPLLLTSLVEILQKEQNENLVRKDFLVIFTWRASLMAASIASEPKSCSCHPLLASSNMSLKAHLLRQIHILRMHLFQNQPKA